MAAKLSLRKSTFLCRRNIIIYIVSIILVLGIVAGFTNTFRSDNRRYAAAWGETIVFEEAPPTTGSPSDYDLLTNLKYSAYKIHHSSYFRGDTEGVVSADIGIGTYKQYLTNVRVVHNENTVFQETISWSSLKSVAEQKYADMGVIIFRPSEKMNGNKPTYSPNGVQMSYKDYSEKYGTVPNQLSKYIIDETTILAVKDDNAAVKAPLNSARNGDVSFTVPDKLVPDSEGNYSITLTLDPDKSSRYYRNEVRTLGGADNNPLFHSVQITVKIDKDWNPISTRTKENYDIEIPVLGKMNCSGDNYEVFSQINDENGELPEKDFFQPLVDEALSNPDFVPPDISIDRPLSASDYLAAAFSDYLSGEKNLDLKLDVDSDILNAYDLYVSLNLNTMNLDAMLGNGLYVKYAGDKVYLNLGSINGYLSTDKFGELLKDERISKLMGRFTLDLNKMFGGDMLDVIFSGCDMTTENDVTRIPLSFALDLSDISPAIASVPVDAVIQINDADKSLLSIIGDITVAGVGIHIDITPSAMPKTPSVKDAVDLSGIACFIPDILTTAQNKTFGLDGSVTVDGNNIGVSAYVDVTDGITADATIDAFGMKVAVKYVDGFIYVGMNGLTVRGTVDELPELISVIGELVGLGKYQSLISSMLPSSVNDYVKILNALTVSDDTLGIGLKFINIPADIRITRNNGVLSGLALGVNVNMFGIKLDAAADFALSYPAHREVQPIQADSYVTFAQLKTIINNVKPYLQAQSFDLTVLGSVLQNGKTQTLSGHVGVDLVKTKDEITGIDVAGILSALDNEVKFTYVGGTCYVDVNDIKLKADTTDLGTLLSAVGKLSGMKEIGEVDTDKLTTALINSLSISDDGKITLNVPFGEDRVIITIDTEKGMLDVIGHVSDCAFGLTAFITPAEKPHGFSAPAAEEINGYIDVNEFAPAIETIAELVDKKGMSANLGITFGGMNLAAKLTASFDNGELKLNIAEQSLGLNVTLIGDTAYISLGDIKVSGRLKDLTDLIAAVLPNLPLNIRPYVLAMNEQILDMIPSASDFTEGDKTDLAKIIDFIRSTLALSVNDGYIGITAKHNGLSVKLNSTYDLSDINGDITLTFNGIGGPFGDSYAITVGLGIYDLTPMPVTIAPIDPTEYVPAHDILAAVDCVLPLVGEPAFDLSFEVNVYGQTVTGSAYVNLADYDATNMCASITLSAADVDVKISVINKTLYLDINNGGVRIAQPLSAAAIKELIAQIDQAIPSLKLGETIGSLLPAGEVDLSGILDKIALSPTTDGFNVTVDTVTVAVRLLDGKLNGIDVYTTASAQPTVTIGATVRNNILTSVELSAIIGETEMSAVVAIAPAEQKELAVDGTYVSPADIIPYISPIMALMDEAKGAQSITLPIAATLDIMGTALYLEGNVVITLDPVTVDAQISLFANTADVQMLNVRYAGGVLYLQTGTIMLSFDINTDPTILLNAVKDYLPPCFSNIKDLAALTTIPALIDTINGLTKALDIQSIIDVLFTVNAGTGKTAIKHLVDMISLTYYDGELTASLSIIDGTPFDLIVNVTPVLTAVNDKTELSVKLKTSVMSVLSVNLTTGIVFGDQAPFGAPARANEYVPLVAFVQTVMDGVNTLTASAPETNYTDENGVQTTVRTIAFEVDSFGFDYDIFKVATAVDGDGNTVEVVDEETGRKVIATDEDGNKIVSQHIDVSNADGQKALAFKYVTTTTGGVKSSNIAIEAHIALGIKESSSEYKLGFPIELNLYVADGLAYLYYMESNGYGEKISLDYDSIMEIVAAFMDILSVDDRTVESLLGKYRLDIDKTVFESMNIAALDTIRDLINNAAKAFDQAKLALADIKSALDVIYSQDTDITTLIRQLRNDENDDGTPTVRSYISSAIEYLTTAIGYFSGDAEDAEEPEAQESELNGALYGKVVNAVAFVYETGRLTANVDNNIATGTEGTAVVSVDQDGDKIDTIAVSNLDVNTAKLNKFEMVFTAGREFKITVPTDEFTSTDKVAYSDLANIKHMLFDVMNTANMLEFEIGGFDGVEDIINIHLKLGADWLANIDISVQFKAQVKIIKVGEENGKPIYKTAAAIELRNSASRLKILGINSSYLLPYATTRLYFYDDVIYIQGIDDWTMSNENVHYKSSFLGIKSYDKTDVLTSVNYVNVAYTVNELGYMMSNDISRFLNEFLFYLIPITKDKIAGQDIRKLITDNISSSDSGNTVNTQNTIAQIFKSYSYDGSAHKIVVGLAELAGSSSLSDLTLTLTGANDGDTNILDNYISGLSVTTNIASIIDVTLKATLRNVSVNNVYYTDADKTQLADSGVITEYVRAELEPVPLSLITLDYDKAIYEYDGVRYLRNGTSTNYVFNDGNAPAYTLSEQDLTYYTIEQINNTLLAEVIRDNDNKITAIVNRNNGISWTRPWQNAYEQAQQAAA